MRKLATFFFALFVCCCVFVQVPAIAGKGKKASLSYAKMAERVLLLLEKGNIKEAAKMMAPNSARYLKRPSTSKTLKESYAITGKFVPGSLKEVTRMPYRGLLRIVFSAKFKKDSGRVYLVLNKKRKIVGFVFRTPKLVVFYKKQMKKNRRGAAQVSVAQKAKMLKLAKTILGHFENGRIKKAASYLVPKAAAGLKKPHVVQLMKRSFAEVGKSIPNSIKFLYQTPVRGMMRYQFSVRFQKDVGKIYMVLSKIDKGKVMAFVVRSPKMNKIAVAHHTHRMAEKILKHMQNGEFKKAGMYMIPRSAKAMNHPKVRASLKTSFALIGKYVPGSLEFSTKVSGQGMTRFVYRAKFKKDKGTVFMVVNKRFRVVAFVIRTPKLIKHFKKQAKAAAAKRAAAKKTSAKKTPAKKRPKPRK